MSNDVIVKMTRKQLEKLVDVLDDTRDEGPPGAGWASPELTALRNLFGSELEELTLTEPVAIVQYHDICADHNGQVLALDYLPQGTKLYAAPAASPAKD